MKTKFRTRASKILRTLGILKFTDKLRFFIFYLRTFKERRRFIKSNPNISTPPAYLIYEAFDLNYDSYYFASRRTATWLLDFFRKHCDLVNINILDWGCGPARIIRHLPELLDKSCHLYGTDYNHETISWNKKAIKGINFNLNDEEPPLPYVNNSFNIIYGISIFTHLSYDLHLKWFNELIRISKNQGILFLTLQGSSFRIKLTSPEIDHFDKGELITRGNTKIGHRTYTAFHPPAFIHDLIKGHQVLEHIEGGIINNKPQQDIWIIRVIK
jgi:SAM-dependent methyltransferase